MTIVAALFVSAFFSAIIFHKLGFRAGCKEGRLEARDMVSHYNYHLNSPTVRMITRALYDFCDGNEISDERKRADAEQIVHGKLERAIERRKQWDTEQKD